MPTPPILKGRIYQVIHMHGPLTYEEIGEHMTDVSLDTIKSCIWLDRHKSKNKVFRVADWRRNYGRKGLPSPLIGLGNEPDAEQPDLSDSHNEAQKRYNAKRPPSTPEQKKARNLKLAAKKREKAKSGLVFASMFSPPAPVVVNQPTGRVYRTSDRTPIPKAKQNQ